MAVIAVAVCLSVLVIRLAGRLRTSDHRRAAASAVAVSTDDELDRHRRSSTPQWLLQREVALVPVRLHRQTQQGQLHRQDAVEDRITGRVLEIGEDDRVLFGQRGGAAGRKLR